MKKIIYFAQSNLEDKSDGVSQKIIGQMKGFIELGFDVYTFAYSNNFAALYNGNMNVISVSNDNAKYKSKRNKLIDFTFKNLTNLNADILYVRFSHLTSRIIKLLKNAKMMNMKIYMEIPSYPITYPRTIKGFIFKSLDFKYSSKLSDLIDKTLSVGSKTDNIFGVDNINIPNGINNFNVHHNQYNYDSNKLKFLSISGMYDIHANDRIIKGFGEYFDKNPDTKIEIHFVGSGPLEEELINLTKKLNLTNNIFFHGKLYGEKLENMYKASNIGISALGIHRKGYKTASPLKSKEYINRNIPFVLSYDEISMPNNTSFLFKIPSDDSPVDFEYIIEKYINLKDTNYNEDFANVKLKYFSWKNIFKKVIFK